MKERTVKQLLEKVFYEDWMEEEDLKNIVNEFMVVSGKSYDELYDELMVGVNNGHSLEEQAKYLREFFDETRNSSG